MDTYLIKYRAWDVKRKLMMQVTVLDLQRQWVTGIADGEEIDARFDEVIVRPWTHRFDSKVRDIYEGDIISCRYYYGPKKGGHYKDEYWIVCYDLGDFWLHNLKSEQNMELNFVIGERRCTIIGNRYENPELLEVTK